MGFKIGAGISASASMAAGISSAAGGVGAQMRVNVGDDKNVLRGRDVLNSNLGVAYIRIPEDGTFRRIFELKDISATIEQRKEDVQLINDVMTKHKCVASNGSGSFVIYSGVPDYSTMIRRYIDTHRGLYFTIEFMMDDPESTRGRRKVTLKDVLIDSHQLGRLSVDSTILDEEMGFTFDEYSIDADFNPIA